MSDRIRKGDLAEQAVIKDLLKRKYQVAKPIGTDWRFDLILFRDNKFERLQVKWCKSDENKISLSCRSTSYSSKINYTQNDIDWLVAYDENTDKCYYVPSTILGNCGRSLITLRLKPLKMKNQYNCLDAENFLDI